MKISDVALEDGKKCSQLMNFLKIANMPPDMKVADCIALAETMGWLNGLVKQIAESLSEKSKAAPAAPAMILPIPKKKGKK